MSLVGTRPPTVDEWEKYELHHRSRMSIKPGITGMWQASGRSDITDFEEVVKLDTEYIENWSIEWACVSETDTILYEPCIPFYDGQRFWYVLRLLPEIQGSENRCGRVLYQKIQQDLAIFRITLCA